MKNTARKMFRKFDDIILRRLGRFLWPEYKCPRHGYWPNHHVLRKYFFAQKILRINGSVPWPVDFRTEISSWEKIDKGIVSLPGANPGLYINASGGLKIGNNVGIGANTTITTSNHDMYNHLKKSKVAGVTIGDNVWVGANCSILAGVNIGSNVTIGAGCVIRKDIPSNSIVVTDEVALKRVRKKGYQWDCTKEELI